MTDNVDKEAYKEVFSSLSLPLTTLIETSSRDMALLQPNSRRRGRSSPCSRNASVHFRAGRLGIRSSRFPSFTNLSESRIIVTRLGRFLGSCKTQRH